MFWNNMYPNFFLSIFDPMEEKVVPSKLWIRKPPEEIDQYGVKGKQTK